MHMTAQLWGGQRGREPGACGRKTVRQNRVSHFPGPIPALRLLLCSLGMDPYLSNVENNNNNNIISLVGLFWGLNENIPNTKHATEHSVWLGGAGHCRRKSFTARCCQHHPRPLLWDVLWSQHSTVKCAFAVLAFLASPKARKKQTNKMGKNLRIPETSTCVPREVYSHCTGEWWQHSPSHPGS